MKRYEAYSIMVCLIAIVAPVCAFAQAAPEGQSADDLRRQLDELRSQMATQMKQMNALQARLDEMERQKTTVPANALTAGTAAAGPEQLATLPAGTSSQEVSQATTEYETFGEDSEAAPRVDNAPLDPRYPGFFRLPGTNTFLKIGGYFKTDFIYDGNPPATPTGSYTPVFPPGCQV